MVTIREERRLRYFDNKILRRVSGPKREYRGGWRICVALDLGSLPDIFTVID